MNGASWISDTWHDTRCNAVAQTMPCGSDLLCDDDVASKSIPVGSSFIDDDTQRLFLDSSEDSSNILSHELQHVVPSQATDYMHPMGGEIFSSAPQYAMVPPGSAVGARDLSTFTNDPIVPEHPIAGFKRGLDQDHVNRGTQVQPRQAVLEAIEELILSIIEKMAIGLPLELPSFARQTKYNQQDNKPKRARKNAPDENIAPSSSTPDLQQQSIGSSSTDTSPSLPSSFSLPSSSSTSPAIRSVRPTVLNSPQSAKTFARYLRVMEIIHEAVSTNVMVSKRDIFYRDVALFGTQRSVDKIIEDISFYFNVPRSCLNVTAASKGLMFGAAKIVLKNGKNIDCISDTLTDDEYCSDEQGVLIPPTSQIARVECQADFVLVIEKEASFRHLVSTGFHQLFPRCILLTGRGYPDIATRHMIKYLSIQNSQMPILALVDGDPYGLDIYAVYKWGSHAQAFDAPNLAVRDIQLLGICSKDRSRFHLPVTSFAPLTPRDRRKAICMVTKRSETHASASDGVMTQENWIDSTSDMEDDHRTFVLEVISMLHRNMKCELQSLCSESQFGMMNYVRHKVNELLENRSIGMSAY